MLRRDQHGVGACGSDLGDSTRRVENGFDETAILEGVLPADFEPVEERLLARARELLGRLPFTRGDLLIVDEIGKDISGSGMDTNVVGRKRAFRSQPAPPGLPVFRLIYVRGLTEHTFGNAAGIGLADFTSTRLVQEMDYRQTVINCLTAGYPEGAFTPVHFGTDREAALKRYCEEWDDIEATIQLVRETKPDDIGVSTSYPLPNTRFHQIVQSSMNGHSNWRDSGDLGAMFQSAFPSELYRALADALHAEVRGNDAAGAWEKVEQLRCACC